VVSIFVNPIQFGPNEDFDRYPRDLARDRRLLRGLGVDCVFAPSVGEMYPPGFATGVDVGELGRRLCGKYRPGHFNGVATVVARLFSIVGPDVAVFGQKDAQQAIVIRRMTRDLGFGTRIMVRPTMREPDGLAMSSRNRYLSGPERRAATVLHRALELAREMVGRGEDSAGRVKSRMRALARSEPRVRLQYLAVVDPETLEPVTRIRGATLAALAAFVGRTRLIDNAVLRPGA
jgi:pantoate--beta-alanine ligase